VKPVVLKFGGELLENEDRSAVVVAAVSSLAAEHPIVIVHGGGKEIDAALDRAGIEKQQIDGLRITDERTLDVVVATLAGLVNTRFVAALNAAGVRAVGLTGADANCGLSNVAFPLRAADGRTVDLGRVGVPVPRTDIDLIETLVGAGFVPVIACIGVEQGGRLLNVNADTLAGHLAARLDAARLVIAGATPGVLGKDGVTLPLLNAAAVSDLVAGGTATAGMIAKLRACEHALAHRVEEVLIVDGRDRVALERAAQGRADRRMTRLVRMVPA
jgi:acetylglutamate kinase